MPTFNVSDDTPPEETKNDIALTVRVTRQLRDILYEAARAEHREGVSDARRASERNYERSRTTPFRSARSEWCEAQLQS
jgi:hypothetical protein